MLECTSLPEKLQAIWISCLKPNLAEKLKKVRVVLLGFLLLGKDVAFLVG